jgi:hypothetical protein
LAVKEMEESCCLIFTSVRTFCSVSV